MTDDIGKDLEALRPLPARLAELTSDLRKLATCGKPTCLERRALSMLEELGLELAQPGANVVEFDKYQPSAGEVLKQLDEYTAEPTGLVAMIARSVLGGHDWKTVILLESEWRDVARSPEAAQLRALLMQPTPKREALERKALERLSSIWRNDAVQLQFLYAAREKDGTLTWTSGINRAMSELLRKLAGELDAALARLTAPADAGGEG